MFLLFDIFLLKIEEQFLIEMYEGVILVIGCRESTITATNGPTKQYSPVGLFEDMYVSESK